MHSFYLVRQVSLPSIKSPVDELALSSNGKVAALKVRDTVTTFNATTWKPLHTFHANLKTALNQFALSPDGKTVALVHYQQGTRWSSRQGLHLELRSAFTGRLHRRLFQSDLDNYVVFSPNGQTLVTMSAGLDSQGQTKTLVCWNTLSGKLEWRSHSRRPSPPGTFDPVYDELRYSPLYHSCGLAISPDGRTVATEISGLVELRSAQTGRRQRTISDKQGVQAPLVFSANGETLATAGDVASYGWNNGPDESAPYHTTSFCSVKIWSTQTGTKQAVAKGPEPRASYIYVPLAFWPNQNTVAAVSYLDPPGLVLFNAVSGAEVWRQEEAATYDPVATAVSPDQRFLLTITHHESKVTLNYWKPKS